MPRASSVSGRARPSGGRRASFIGSLHGRGRVWWLSVLWVVMGAGITGYTFFITTKPFTNADFWIPLWNTEPEAVRVAAYLTVAAWVVLTIPVLIAGFARLRWSAFRMAAWAGAWVAGFALMYQAGKWGEYPGSSPVIGSPAVVSWGELGLCVAWLALGVVMIWTLAGPAHGSGLRAAVSAAKAAEDGGLP